MKPDGLHYCSINIMPPSNENAKFHIVCNSLLLDTYEARRIV